MKRWLGVVMTVLIGAAVVAVTAIVASALQSPPSQLRANPQGQASTATGPLVRASLELATYPDSLAGEHGKGGGPHPGWVSYGPTTNLRVPAHALVTVTIRQYDSGGTITNPFFASVRGTVDGSEQINGKTVRGIDPNAVGHTFTIHGLTTNQPWLFVSAPLPAVPDDAPNLANGYPAPQVVTFEFVTGAPGHYVWQCEYPCGDSYVDFGGPMSTQGYMAGTLTVS